MSTATQTKDDDHGRQNAIGWAETIAELVSALECDYDRLYDLLQDRQSLVDELHDAEDKAAAQRDIDAWDEENGADLDELKAAATYEGELQRDADSVRERIQEGPLCIEVRSDWYFPGASEDDDARKPAEFKILLSTGGPALRIIGELNEYGEPTRARLEYQDWFTPWVEYNGDAVSDDNLLTYCRQFYFGE